MRLPTRNLDLIITERERDPAGYVHVTATTPEGWLLGITVAHDHSTDDVIHGLLAAAYDRRRGRPVTGI